MASKTNELNSKHLLPSCPKFLPNSVQYEVVMGSVAYGVSNDQSDCDVYGFAIPPRDHLFPHLNGFVLGFDELPETFQQFQQHKIIDAQARGGKGREYDLTIYSIAKYFRLLVDGNPNIVDSLFVPRRCVLYSTSIGERIREQRQLFLHKGCWPTFKGYAYTQMHKMRSTERQGKRKAVVEAYGYDLKFAYHVVRLLNEIEQILVEGTLELDRNSDQLKAIRRGDWTREQVEQYFHEKERSLELSYAKSALPVKADGRKIKSLLLECLEQHYGSLSQCVAQPDSHAQALREIQNILDGTKI